MLGVLTGFAIVGSLIALGVVVSRLGVLGEGAERVLSRTAFWLATPALMFYLLATADRDDLLSPGFAVAAITAGVSIALFVLVAVLARWGVERAVVGGLVSGYVNAGNLGLPVATYVLGSATLIAPVMLLQLMIIAPVALSILDIATGREGGLARRLTRPLLNPIVLASLAGVVVSVSGVRLPDPVLEPFALLGHATVPMMLIAFGMSLRQGGLPLRSGDRAPILVASAIKALIAPVIATLVGVFVIPLSSAELLAAVLCASLPTAQNVFVYASRYGGAVVLARDAVLLTTVLAVPVLLVGSVVLPGLK